MTYGDVKHIGLKAIISNQILKKYSKNKGMKNVENIKLVIPKQGIKVDKKQKILWIPSLKLKLEYHFDNSFKRITQIEVDNEFAYIAIVYPEKEKEEPDYYIGVDRNTRGHIAVVAHPKTGKVWKFGKNRMHTHKKYENMKRQFEKKGKFKKLKTLKVREKRKIKDMNHKISHKIVDIAIKNNSGIKLENLSGNKKKPRITREYSLNSWSFHQLQQFIEYKARLHGVKIAYIDPHSTSKNCSRCGLTGKRHSKNFECPHCGHVDHADVNASFNIALKKNSIGQFTAERDAVKGSTDTPQTALAKNLKRTRKANHKTSIQYAWEVCQFLS